MMIRVLTALLLAMALQSCGSTSASLSEQPERGAIFEEGIASYYHDSLHGNLTASGEPYDREALTAAHRSLPFGTRIRVTNLENERSVILTINDRGPFVAGRIVDLSRRAARELGSVEAGIVKVTIAIVN
jgi:rare lipoprotein A